MDWNDGLSVLQQALTSYPPEQVVFLLGLFPDHLFDFVQRLAAALGGASVLRYGLQAELEGGVTLQDAAQKLFGMSHKPYFDVWNADVVFSFGAGSGEAWLPSAAGTGAQGWTLPARPLRQPYWVQFDHWLSPAAQQADEWLQIAPGSQAILAQSLARRVNQLRGDALVGEARTSLQRAAAVSGVCPAELERLARLFAGAARPSAVPGASTLGGLDGLSTAQAILSLNIAAANGDCSLQPVSGLAFMPQLPLCSAPAGRSATLAEMTVLTARLRRGQVRLLLVHGVDPVSELPESLGFVDALRQIERVISFSPRLDATSAWADYILPDCPPGTSQGYQRTETAWDRPALLALQPAAELPTGSRPTVDALLAAVHRLGGGLAASLPFTSQLDYLKRTVYTLNAWGGFYQAGNIDEFWAAWQQHGGWWTPSPLRFPAVPLQGVEPTRLQTGLSLAGEEYPLRLLLIRQPQAELGASPWIALSPPMANRLGLRAGQRVEVRSLAGALQANLRLDASLESSCAAMPVQWGRRLPGAAVNETGSLAWSAIPVSCSAV